MKKTILTTAILLTAIVAFGQGVAINENSAAPNESAMLDISSTSKGLLIPRLNNAQMTTITNAATGLLVFNTDYNCFYFRSVYGWQKIISEGNNHTIFDADGMSYLSFMNDPGETDTLRIFFDEQERYKISSRTIEVLNNQGSVYIGLKSGKNNTTGTVNTALGSEALMSNTTGLLNVALGYRALRENTTGQRNVALGPYTLLDNTTGSHNTSIGAFTLRNNTSGDYNSAFGRLALWANTTGSYNVAAGPMALFSNTDRSNLVAIGDSALYSNGLDATQYFHATQNTAVGSKALKSNTYGFYNTALGFHALSSNTTGYENTATGTRAMESNTSGDGNTAYGFRALNMNESGYANTASGRSTMLENISGSFNTASGYAALRSNSTGSLNTAYGSMALMNNTTGDTNTALGYRAGYGVTGGSRNILIGYNAGHNIINGSNNIIIGHNLEALSANAQQQLIIGAADLFYGDLNKKRIGIGTSAPSALLHTYGVGTGQGNVLHVGQFKSSDPGAPPATGTGTRMMWYPDKAAFRAGYVGGTAWDKNNIGNYSVALGYGSIAQGLYSFAAGGSNLASGRASVALGNGGTASGDYAFAMGTEASAEGDYAFAMGTEVSATGVFSIAIGAYLNSAGEASVAMGSDNSATGNYSAAIGYSLTAPSYAETVIGSWNTIYTGSAGTWNPNNRLFVVANGTADNARSNALTVLKNGNVGIGVSVPDQKLDIDGQIKIRGGSPGAGKVLTSDANGNASWQSGAATYQVGDFAHGGIVFWVDATGQRGLVCAKTDQYGGSKVRWNAGTNQNTMSLGGGPIAGKMNTAIIIASQGFGDGNTYAARICNELQITEGGKTYGDWYLPSREELLLMFQNIIIINATAVANGGSAFDPNLYWSSLEHNTNEAWSVHLGIGQAGTGNKGSIYRIRAVRTF